MICVSMGLFGHMGAGVPQCQGEQVSVCQDRAGQDLSCSQLLSFRNTVTRRHSNPSALPNKSSLLWLWGKNVCFLFWGLILLHKWHLDQDDGQQYDDMVFLPRLVSLSVKVVDYPWAPDLQCHKSSRSNSWCWFNLNLSWEYFPK